MNYNKIVCNLSQQTIESYGKDELQMFITAFSIGESFLTSASSALPFIFDVKFEDSFMPSNPKSKHQLLTMATWLSWTFDVKFIDFESKKETVYKVNEISDGMKDEVAERIVSVILDSNKSERSVQVKRFNCWFDLVPYVAKKSSFDVIKNNDYICDYRVSCREDLYKLVPSKRLGVTNDLFEDDCKEYKKQFDYILSLFDKGMTLKYTNASLSDNDPFNLNLMYRKSYSNSVSGYEITNEELVNDFFDIFWITYVLRKMNMSILPRLMDYPSSNYDTKSLRELKERLSAE